MEESSSWLCLLISFFSSLSFLQEYCSYLGDDGEGVALAGVNDIDSLRVSEARPLEGVGSQQVARLLGELHSPDSVLSASLHDEGVVIADQVPNQGVRHCISIFILFRNGLIKFAGIFLIYLIINSSKST